jgi:hypothetical protein
MPTPAEQAKSMGLEYGGFGGWIDPKTRKVVAKTIDGNLVRTSDQNAGDNDLDMGRLVILDFDDELLYAKPEDAGAVKKYIKLIKSILKSGSDFVVLTARNSEKKVAKFLRKVGVTSGLKLKPYGSADPHKKKIFIKKKIDEGYSEIQFFDRDPKALHAAESLKAPYNKLDVRIDTHKLPTFKQVKADVAKTPSAANPKAQAR